MIRVHITMKGNISKRYKLTYIYESYFNRLFYINFHLFVLLCIYDILKELMLVQLQKHT